VKTNDVCFTPPCSIHHESCEPFPESARPRGRRYKRQRFFKMWHRITGEKPSAMPISGRAPKTAELVDVLRGLRLLRYRTQSAILESCILALPYPEAKRLLTTDQEILLSRKGSGTASKNLSRPVKIVKTYLPEPNHKYHAA